MIIDRRSRPWIVFSLILWAVATVLYVLYVRSRPNGPSGGSWPGILFGSIGSAMMLFAMLLNPRRKVRTMRIGRAYWWMQGHIWFGLLSYPIILYHAGFHWGGPLTQVLMWLFTIVIVSGIIGLALQQFIPSKMLRDVTAETIYEQIAHVLEQLRGEAAQRVHAVTDRLEQEAYEVEVVPAGGTALMTQQRAVNGAALLLAFYKEDVAPFLADRIPPQSKLASELTSAAAFNVARQALPAQLHETLADLQSMVDERRQIERQRRLHNVLHGWLLVHVPLSFALLILGLIHAVYALRFTTIGG